MSSSQPGQQTAGQLNPPRRGAAAVLTDGESVGFMLWIIAILYTALYVVYIMNLW